MPEHKCDACREFATTRRCTGCRKAWYCNATCQRRHWVFHIFECNPRRPINTADYLALAVRKDLLPTDPQTLGEWGLDKARVFSPGGPFKLFGLFVGLIKYQNVKPQRLHEWRLQGRLIPEIKAIYEAIPGARSRGSYYSWFLEHQSVLEEPKIKEDEHQLLIEDMQRRGWIALGKPSTTSSSTIRAYIQNLPADRRTCFTLWTSVHSSVYPGPDKEEYREFGFCACPTLYEEMELSRAYMELLSTCTFDDLCNAYSSRTLLELFQLHDVALPPMQAHLLADVLRGDSHGGVKSVWDLKQWIACEGRGTLALPSAVDYGFDNCSSQDDRKLLISLYKTFFESWQSNPLKLHAACIEGRLLDFFVTDMKMTLPGSRKRFKRLLRNCYPLPEIP